VFSNISLTKDFSEQFFPVAKCNESIETELASGLKVPGHWPECPNPFSPVAAVGKISFSKS